MRYLILPRLVSSKSVVLTCDHQLRVAFAHSFDTHLFFLSSDYVRTHTRSRAEFREAALLINEKATAKARTNMIFNLCIGFSELECPSAADARGKTFAVMVADTVAVTDDVCEVW